MRNNSHLRTLIDIHSALRIPHSAFLHMPDFAYTARDATGQKVTGVISAANQREVLAQLAGTVAVSARRSIHRRPKRPSAAARRGQGRRLMATTYSQLSGLLRSGVPLLRSIDVLRQSDVARGLEGSALAGIRRRGRRSDAGRGHGAASPRVQRNGRQHGPRRRRRRLSGRCAGARGAVHRTAGRPQGPDRRGAGLSDVSGRRRLVVVYRALIVFFVPKFEVLFDRLRERGELPAMTEWLLAHQPAGWRRMAGSRWCVDRGHCSGGARSSCKPKTAS